MTPTPIGVETRRRNTLFDFNSRIKGQLNFLSHAFLCTEGVTLAISSPESDEDPAKMAPNKLSQQDKPCVFLHILFSAAATWRFTAMKLSGVTERESIPHVTRNSANSGWSLGACPHSPTFAPDLCASAMTVWIIHFTAGVLFVEQFR